MSIKELESAIQRLSPKELSRLERWFDDFLAEKWDRQFESDAKSGRLDQLGKQADKEFEAGRCNRL